jgi:hypothetical protein
MAGVTITKVGSVWYARRRGYPDLRVIWYGPGSSTAHWELNDREVEVTTMGAPGRPSLETFREHVNAHYFWDEIMARYKRGDDFGYTDFFEKGRRRSLPPRYVVYVDGTAMSRWADRDEARLVAERAVAGRHGHHSGVKDTHTGRWIARHDTRGSGRTRAPRKASITQEQARRRRQATIQPRRKDGRFK